MLYPYCTSSFCTVTPSGDVESYTNNSIQHTSFLITYWGLEIER